MCDPSEINIRTVECPFCGQEMQQRYTYQSGSEAWKNIDHNVNIGNSQNRDDCLRSLQKRLQALEAFTDEFMKKMSREDSNH